MNKMRLIVGGLVTAGVGLALFASLTPQKFLKLVSLRTEPDVSIHSKLSTNNVLDPEKLISSIPYDRGRFVDVMPKRRYERSIINGKGDCSNLAHGLAYWLLEKEIDFSIIHLLKMPGFVDGEGHVALEAAMTINGNNQSAVLDLLEGGVLSNGSEILSAADLLVGNNEQIKVIPYHPSRDDKSRYYEKAQLENTLLGFTPNEEIERYFNFIETIYLDLGHKKIERYLFDSIALLLGMYPKIYISVEDQITIDKQYGNAQSLSIILLVFLRALFLVAILFIIFYVIRRLTNFRLA